MTESTRDYVAALAYARSENAHESRNWTGMCQMFVRSCYGLGGGFGSAYAQWLGMPSHAKHPGGHPSSAPVGAALFYKGSGQYGHIMLAARPFPSGVSAAWSTDLVTTGDVDKVNRTAPTTKWNQAYLGWGTNINGVDLDLTHASPAKQVVLVHYKNIADSIDQMKLALKTAENQKDAADIKIIQAEIVRLEKMHDTLRRRA